MAVDKNNLRKECSSTVHHQSSDLCCDNHGRVQKPKGLLSAANSTRPSSQASGERAPFLTSRNLIPTGSAWPGSSQLQSSGENATLRLAAYRGPPLSLLQGEQGRAGAVRVAGGNLALGKIFFVLLPTLFFSTCSPGTGAFMSCVSPKFIHRSSNPQDLRM